MNELGDAWEAFADAVTEAQEPHPSAARAEVLEEVLHRARELLCALEDALAAGGKRMPADNRNALEELRAWLIDLEATQATRH